jgi:uracil-DNA glycosylase
MVDIHNYNYKSWNNKYKNNKVNLRELYINDSWNNFFNRGDIIEILKDIEKFFEYCLKKTNGRIRIFPYPDLLFSSFNYTPLNKLKVVILGQDPYHNYEIHNNKIIPQAMGLSFSVPKGIKIPSSLNNIFKNMKNYNQMIFTPDHGDLSFLAYQGCLFLNTSLTVQLGYPNSHAKKWVSFTNKLIEYISKTKNNLVFVLWGNPSLNKLNLIDKNKHKVIVSSHPSGLSCNRNLKNYNSFNSTNHFELINNYLNEKIIWQI